MQKLLVIHTAIQSFIHGAHYIILTNMLVIQTVVHSYNAKTVGHSVRRLVIHPYLPMVLK